MDYGVRYSMSAVLHPHLMRPKKVVFSRILDFVEKKHGLFCHDVIRVTRHSRVRKKHGLFFMTSLGLHTGFLARSARARGRTPSGFPRGVHANQPGSTRGNVARLRV